jgi:hypothetical protein
VAISDPATAHFTAIKTWQTQVSHTNQGKNTIRSILTHHRQNPTEMMMIRHNDDYASDDNNHDTYNDDYGNDKGKR